MAGRTRRTNLEMIKDQIDGLKTELERKKARKQRILDRIEEDTQTVSKLDKEIKESEDMIEKLGG